MDCEKFDRVVLDLLYEELDELTSAAARRHMDHCARCKSIAAGLRATRQLAVLEVVEPSPDLETRILAAERRARAGMPFGKRVGRAVSVLAGYAMRPQLAMAAVALLMIGTSVVLVRSRPGSAESVRVTERGVPESEPGAAAPAAVAAAPAASVAEAPAAAVASGDSGTSDAYGQALAAYRAGRYSDAEARFDAIAKENGADAAPSALYAAESAKNASGCGRAAPRFEAVSLRFPGTGVAHEAAWEAATCFKAVGKNDDARRNYRTLIGVAGYGDRAEAALASLELRVAGRRSAGAPPATTAAGAAADNANATVHAAPAAPPPSEAAKAKAAKPAAADSY